ncbi:MAG: CD1871A family CXXC motif-containing protein [Eubacteriales bacterium]|nr:CD1871A family CXXC motif-containing protein [Eubacteriales bacterium]
MKADRLWLPLALVGAVMMVFGVLRGEAAVVLNKAIRICLECIGVG